MIRVLFECGYVVTENRRHRWSNWCVIEVCNMYSIYEKHNKKHINVRKAFVEIF